jgi:hypothetical protein
MPLSKKLWRRVKNELKQKVFAQSKKALSKKFLHRAKNELK